VSAVGQREAVPPLETPKRLTALRGCTAPYPVSHCSDANLVRSYAAASMLVLLLPDAYG